MNQIRTMMEGLEAGRVSSQQLVEESLEAISDTSREGRRAFLGVSASVARAAAAGFDHMRANGVAVPPFAGIPLAIKDLFDVRGEVTTAGSTVLANAAPAASDAPSIGRLRRSGFIPIGRTHMTEFAYSGLGLNSHYDTPASTWDRATRRIPGGSSSGSAVAVGDNLVPVALGTDTGGSCRIPAAFNGIVGYKPTASRVPTTGVFPLARSLDSVGPLASSVDCCAIVDDLLTGGNGDVDHHHRPANRIRLGLVVDYVMDDVDEVVAKRFESGIRKLNAQGVDVVEVGFVELARIAELNRNGGLVQAQAWAVHRSMLKRHGDHYDQRVRNRIEPGANMSAADYLDIVDGRAELIEIARRRLDGLDAFVFPTVAVVAPPIASFDRSDADYYSRTNLMCLRNTTVTNFLDGCAISIPLCAPGQPEVGMQLMASAAADHQLLAVARTVESLLDSHPSAP